MIRKLAPRTLAVGLILGAFFVSCRRASTADYPLRAVPITSVKLTDGFWAPRLETNRAVTIPFALDQSELTGRVRNFEIAGGLAKGSFCSKYPFDDSDVYKVIEGAAYSLMLHPDPELEKCVDGAHRQDRRRPGTGRLPLHRPDDRSRPPARRLDGQGALVEPLDESRALQPRPPLRGRRGLLPGPRARELSSGSP